MSNTTFAFSSFTGMSMWRGESGLAKAFLAVQTSHQRELLKQLDQLSEQIREHEHEETRAKIDELFQRVKMPGQNDNGAWIEST
jgi:hypothetical protein